MSRPDSRNRTRLLRAGSGLAFLLAGVIVVAVGGAGALSDLFRAAGTPTTTAHSVAFAIAGLVPPVVLFFATRSVTEVERARRLAGAGAAISAVTAVGSAPVGVASTGSPIVTLLALGYGLGIVVAVLGLLEGVSTAESAGTAGQSVSWQAVDHSQTRSPGPSAGVTPADGGSSDSDLDFPLDSDRSDSDDRD